MAILRCKMCGGDLEIIEGSSSCTCEFCGTVQTIPTVKDEGLKTLFNRANVLRMKSEFDKASEIYEKIVQKCETEAEAYWGLILCKYGIEYVEDPNTFKRIPTCHRASYDAVASDEDYKIAVKYANAIQRKIYEAEAKNIDEVQKGIIALSQKEDPYDVFICYKETDENGKRTQDSVIANDIYYQLTQEGFKVFYAAITLEDKLGSEYEPHIFSALNTAKVMLSLGTKPEYFNAVWVKNEWSRFLKIMKKDRSKILIPCYRDMDAYELPEEFSHLQAQDMSKIGFISDIVRGIKKVVFPTSTITSTNANGSITNIGSLLRRAFMFLEEGDWQQADDFCEQVLNQEPENAEAYLGKLMAKLHVCKQEELEECEEPFDDHVYYQKVIRFADSILSDTLKSYIAHINKRIWDSKNEIYNNALKIMQSAKTQDDYIEAYDEFEKVQGFMDADKMCEKCEDMIHHLHDLELEDKEKRYHQNKIDFKSGQFHMSKEQQQEQERLDAEVKRTASIALKTEEDYVAMPEYIEKENLEKILSSKQVYLEKLGIFKGKEKKLVREEIDELGNKILQLEKKLSEAKKTVDDSKVMAKSCVNAAEAYKKKTNEDNRIRVEHELMEYIGITPLENGNVVFGRWTKVPDKPISYWNWQEIEWRVLAREGTRMLLISEKVIERKKINHSRVHFTWEKCDLRKWLNETFLNTAFSSKGLTHIQNINISTEMNPLFHTEPGNMTNDKVFLLSVSEVRKYFSNGEDMQSKLDEYDVLGRFEKSFDCGWWLRTPGKTQFDASEVTFQGYVSSEGKSACYEERGVRPAMWIDLCC